MTRSPTDHPESKAPNPEEDSAAWRARAEAAERRYRAREDGLADLHRELDRLRSDLREARLAARESALQTLIRAWSNSRVAHVVRAAARAMRRILSFAGREGPAEERREDRAGMPAETQYLETTHTETVPSGPHRRIVVFPEIPACVSVLIPTRNAGHEFERCLRAVREQQGLRAVEIIVIDSSSSDGTPDLARRYGASVTDIPVESFNHGATRNHLAGLASHPFLFFTVQDAVLLGPHALRDLMAFMLEHPRCAAVSAHQVPRTDADLFATFSNLTHETAMEWDRDRILGPVDAGTFHSLPLMSRRRLAVLDNVCCLLRREAWEKLRFRDVSLAEDLDLAIRCMEDGWGLGHLHSVGVAHSHNRPAEYHLRRHLIDRLAVAEIMNDDSAERAAIGDPGETASIGRWICRVAGEKFRGDATAPLDGFLRRVTDYLEPDAFEPAKGRAAADLDVGPDLRGVERLLAAIPESSVSEQALRLMAEHWRHFFTQSHLLEFGRVNRWAGVERSRAFAAKLVGSMIGATLGSSIARHGLPEEQMRPFTSGI